MERDTERQLNRDRELERQNQTETKIVRARETETERERERIPSRLHTVSMEPDAGLELTNHKIMT